MTSSADSENDLSWLRGTRVLVAGGRVSGQATIEPLVALGAVVTVADSTLDFAERCAELGDLLLHDCGIVRLELDEIHRCERCFVR